MREVTVTYTVYRYDELSEKAKRKVLDDATPYLLDDDISIYSHTKFMEAVLEGEYLEDGTEF